MPRPDPEPGYRPIWIQTLIYDLLEAISKENIQLPHLADSAGVALSQASKAVNPTNGGYCVGLRTVSKLADALGYDVKVRLVKKR